MPSFKQTFPINLTRDEQERLHDAQDIQDAFDVPVHEVAEAATPGGSTGETQGREASSSTSPPELPHTPRGQAKTLSDGDLLDAVQSMAEEFVWRIARRDYRRSADLLEKLSSELHEVSEHDRAAAKRRARGDPPKPTRIERARQELRGAYSAICELERVLQWTHDAKDRASAIRAALGTSLAILEDEQ